MFGEVDSNLNFYLWFLPFEGFHILLMESLDKKLKGIQPFRQFLIVLDGKD